MKRRIVALLMTSLIITSALSGCGKESGRYTVTKDVSANLEASVDVEEVQDTEEAEEETLSCKYAGMSADEILNTLTLEQKAAQMVLPAVYNVSKKQMKDNCYGGILSKEDAVSYKNWQRIVDGYQEMALTSEAGIPYLYGQDDVHGVNYATGTVIFPHNIGLGAANDPALMYQVGLITADEAKLCHMLWNYAPCVAQSVDPRWGRTFESYGADLDIIRSLSSEYTRGLVDGGVVACAKHFFADGNVAYGTGENSDIQRLIDRGDARLSDEEIDELLSIYQAQIDAGVQTIMISHSSLNGVKMHENAEYVMRLKDEMGFEGFIVSDWDSVQNTSGATYEEQVINAVNSGIDMLMEVSDYDTAKDIIIGAVNDGRISMDRVDDAVRRILQVKINEGIMEDPLMENMTTVMDKTGSDEYREVAKTLVEESLVLLKNDNDVLPLKEGSTVLIMGPAMDNPQVQCGGWTLDWVSSPEVEIEGVTTILEGFEDIADECGIEVITDESKADEADVIILVVGEQSYVEWLGDTEDLELCGALGLEGNAEAIAAANSYGKPVVTCIVAGRQVIISDYMDNWDSVVMCYLPGSEGQGVASVLCGQAQFSGKLPSPWYSSVNQIGTDNSWLEMGYGLEY